MAPRELAPGECEVWWARASDARPALVSLLDAAERQRLTGFVREGDRVRFLVGASLVRLALASYLGRAPAELVLDRTCGRCGAPHGKPRLADSSAELECSVSHAADAIAVAVAKGSRVGIDVEAVRDLDVGVLAPSALAAQEEAALARLPTGAKTVAFLRLWTLKEAVLKAFDVGLRVALHSLVIATEGPPRIVGRPPEGVLDGEVELRDLEARAGYVASVAIVASTVSVTERDGSPLLAGV